MIDLPLTKKEAMKYKYGTGLQRQVPFDDGRCAYEVWDRTMWPSCHQCDRKPWCGPDQLYCKQHAKIVERRLP